VETDEGIASEDEQEKTKDVPETLVPGRHVSDDAAETEHCRT
jgi:hypothetical protein